jgi:hypothetical protein
VAQRASALKAKGLPLRFDRATLAATEGKMATKLYWKPG